MDDIPVIEGINQEEGLKRIGGNKKLYIKLLNSFYSSHELFESELEELLHKNDFKHLINFVRDVKICNGHQIFIIDF